MTNIMYYVIAFVKIIVSYCKQRGQDKKYFRAQSKFCFVRRYAQIGATIMLAFTYGFAMPVLFFYCFLGVLLITILDKLLITYWEKPRFMNTDKLNFLFIAVLKYSAAFTVVFAAIIIF